MLKNYSIRLIFETSKNLWSDFHWNVSVKVNSEAAALSVAKELFRESNGLSFCTLYYWDIQEVMCKN